MIRNACFALCATATLMTGQSTAAAVSLSARISQVVAALQDHADFSPRSMTLALNGPGNSSGTLFVGLEGVRALNGGDVYRFNEWLNQTPAPAPSNVFNGGGYTFTHSALGSYFNTPSQGSGNGGWNTPYTFTHEVLGSYFGNGSPPDSGLDSSDSETSFVIENDPLLDGMMAGEQESGPVIHYRLMSAPPQEYVEQVPPAVPEPATWAMMIGGFAIVGAAMRRRRTAAHLA